MRGTLRTTWLLLLLCMCSPSDEATNTSTASAPTEKMITSVGSNAPTTALIATATKADTASATVTNVPNSTNKGTEKPTLTTAVVTVKPDTIPTAAETTKPGGPTQPTIVGTNTTPAPTTGGTHVTAVSKPKTTRQTPIPASSSPWSSTVQVLRTTQSFTVSPTNEDNQHSTANIPTNTPLKSTLSALPGSQDPAKGVMKETLTTQGFTSTQGISAGNPVVTSSTTIQAKAEPTPVRTTAGTTLQKTTTATLAQPRKFTYPLLGGQETKEEKDLAKVCQRLMPDWQNVTCIVTWRHHNGKVQFDSVEINVNTGLASKYYEEITKEEPPPNPTNYNTLIAILASCGALLIMIIILTVCASHHHKPSNENQQYLTEELHTVENYYHDNPTLDVMEVQPEMQEKKKVLNGEFNDSWIVPINLMKEDLPEEEDTHL